jgi:excisionase family DNA binding protein
MTTPGILEDIQARLIRLEAALLQRESQVEAMLGPLLSVKKAALLLGVSQQAIRDRVHRGEYSAYWCGRALRVDPDEIKQMMKSHGKVRT